MGLFGPPDVDKLKNKRDVKGLLKALKYRGSATVRKNAALALSEVAPAAPAKVIEMTIAPLMAGFEDSETVVATACVQALGAIGQLAFLPLVSNLRAPSDRSREASARALGRIVPVLVDSSVLKLAIDPLVNLLRDPTPTTRRTAAWSLGRVNTRLEPAQRSMVVESLIIALRDSSPEVREIAASSLGRSEDSRAIRPLIAALEDEATAVRKAASEGVDILGWKPLDDTDRVNYCIARQDWEGAVQVGPIAAASLIRILENRDPASRLSAVQVLGRTGSPDVIAPLVKALKDINESVRIAAAAALEQAGAPEAVDALLQAIRDRDRDVRKAVALALAHTHDERAVPPVLNLLRTHEADMVEVASKALTGLGTHSVYYLVQMLSDPDPSMQDLAAQVLIRIGPPTVMALNNLLRDGQPPLNRLAARILGEIKDPRAVWPLISALQISDMTVPSVQALGKIGDPRAVKPLLELLNTSFAESVQQSTALALGAIGDPLALDPLIQLLRASDHKIRSEAAKALILMYRSGRLDPNQKRKIFEQQDRIIEKHADSRTHQDETSGSDWHVDQNFHADTGIGLDLHTPNP